MTEISFDDKGNELELRENNYYLTLKDDSRRRRIAEIVEKESKFYLVCRRDYEKHFFKNANSWGFNYCMIIDFEDNHPKGCVVVVSDNGKYMVDVVSLLDYGKFLHFKEQGFERQIFLNIELFNKKEKS